MKTTASHMIRCAICVMLFAAFASCKKQTSSDVTSSNAETDEIHDRNYEPQAGDRIKLTGVFKTTKGYMGVVKGVLVPHFCNRDEEALKYKDKRVSVIGTLSKPSYPEPDGDRVQFIQRWLGLELDMESIEILTNQDARLEKVEKLSSKKDNVR
jgi:hypothetical protein